MLLRCIYSAEARQEFSIYRQNTSKLEQIFGLIGAVFGFALLGLIAFGMCESIVVFYHLATTGEAAP